MPVGVGKIDQSGKHPQRRSVLRCNARRLLPRRGGLPGGDRIGRVASTSARTCQSLLEGDDDGADQVLVFPREPGVGLRLDDENDICAEERIPRRAPLVGGELAGGLD